MRTLLSLLASAGLAHADDDARDEVVIRSKSGGRFVQKGTILDFTGRELTIRVTRGGRETTYPAEDVVAVTTGRSEHHVRGSSALKAGEFDEAARELEFALGAEQRQWVRREILALLVRTALATGDGRSARTRFALLLESDPATRSFHLIPLAWSNEPLDAATVREARLLLVHELEPMRLVGTSLLLAHAESRDEATAVLRRLTTSRDDRVRSLALAQQWRTRLAPGLTEHEVSGWQRRFDELPERLRTGPNLVLGRGYERAGQHDRAAMALLWSPLVDDHDPYLAARCLVEAAESLRRIGQDDRAFVLYREVVARYGHTPFADDARSSVAEMTAPRDEATPTDGDTE